MRWQHRTSAYGKSADNDVGNGNNRSTYRYDTVTALVYDNRTKQFGTVNLYVKYQEIEKESAKTKSSLRTLPLVGRFKEYFMQVKEAQKLNKKVCGDCYNYEYDGYVFVDEMGERLKANYLSCGFPELLEKKGLRRMHLHDLRHSCASLLLANGVPLKHIREWLGHSDLAITSNIYCHIDSESKKASAMEIGSALA